MPLTEDGKIPYTAIYAGASHMSRIYSELAANSLTVTSSTDGTLYVIDDKANLRANMDARINATWVHSDGVIEAHILGRTGTEITVRRPGATAPANTVAPGAASTNLRLSGFSPGFWIQAYVGRPFDDQFVLAFGGVSIAQTLQFMKDWGATGEKVGFLFYQAGTNSILSGASAGAIIAISKEALNEAEKLAHICIIQGLTNFDYTNQQLSVMDEVNSWLQAECVRRGKHFKWANWNNAYIVRNGVKLYLEQSDRKVAQWARISRSDMHLNPTSAKAIADTVIRPLIEEYLPIRLNWKQSIHMQKNFFCKMASPQDPLFAIGTAAPPGGLNQASNAVIVNTRNSLNGKINSPGAHTEWVVSSTAPSPNNESFAVAEFSPELLRLRSLIGEKICCAIDVRIPAGSRFTGAWLVVRADDINGSIGEVHGGNNNAGNQPEANLGSETEDVFFTLFTNWFRLPENFSGTRFAFRAVMYFVQSENHNWRPPQKAVFAVSNPRILLKRDWVK